MPPFDRIPEDDETCRLLSDLRSSLDDISLSSLNIDLLGHLYEATASAAERKPAGEFFTDRRIVDALVRWAIPDDALRGGPVPRVLDPAAGSGRFLVAAAERLAEHPRVRSPGGAVDHLLGIDVNPLALHLATVGFTCRFGGQEPESLPTRHTSFFSVHPGDVDDRAIDTVDGTADMIGRFDAIVGNPPYVRAGALPLPREHYRHHLAASGDGSELSRRSDASVYFLTHATRFLRDGGRLAFLVPNKWLASAYGADLRRFLREHYAIHGVVGFGTRAFGDALVETLCILAVRQKDREDRDASTVGFHRLDGPADPEALIAAIRDQPAGGDSNERAVTRTEHARTVTIRQRRLDQNPPAKLTPYLTAPAPVLDLLDDPTLVPPSDLASVSRGVMTGANQFFFLDPDDADRWEIADRFLTPAVKSIRGCATPAVDGPDIDRYVLDVHDYVTAVLDDPTKTSDDVDHDDRGTAIAGDGRSNAGSTVADAENGLDRRVKHALRSDGYDSLADYLAAAEARGRHTGRTCRNRRVWFDLGDLPVPDVFVPKLVRERVFPIRNRAGAVPSNAIDCLTAREGIDPAVLHGVLASSIPRAIMEVWGRDEAGMLQLMTFETETLPVPDIRAWSPVQRAAVREAAAAVIDAPGDQDTGVALDGAVLDACDLGVDLSVDEIRRLRTGLVERRIEDGAGGDRIVEGADPGL